MEALLPDGKGAQHILQAIQQREGLRETDPCRWGIRDISGCQQVLEPEAETYGVTMTDEMMVVGHKGTTGQALAPCG